MPFGVPLRHCGGTIQNEHGLTCVSGETETARTFKMGISSHFVGRAMRRRGPKLPDCKGMQTAVFKLKRHLLADQGIEVRLS